MALTNYYSISNTTLSTLLTELATRNVGPNQIINIYHDGTNHIVIYV